MYRRDQHAGQGELREFAHEVEHMNGGRFRPASCHHVSFPHICGNNEAPGKRVCHLPPPLFVIDGARPDHHPRGTLLEQLLNARLLAHPAAHLYGHGSIAEHFTDELVIVSASGGGIKVHDMQSRKPGALPIRRYRSGIIEAYLFLAVVPTHQLHALAGTQVLGQRLSS